MQRLQLRCVHVKANTEYIIIYMAWINLISIVFTVFSWLDFLITTIITFVTLCFFVISECSFHVIFNTCKKLFPVYLSVILLASIYSMLDMWNQCAQPYPPNSCYVMCSFNVITKNLGTWWQRSTVYLLYSQ